jgi:tetratricopeptide (TPR) repeat protein
LLNNYSESINDAYEAIQLNPDNIKAYLIYGVSICERCKLKKSSDRIQKAIELIKKGIGLCMKEGKRSFEPRMRQCVRRA